MGGVAIPGSKKFRYLGLGCIRGRVQLKKNWNRMIRNDLKFVGLTEGMT